MVKDNRKRHFNKKFKRKSHQKRHQKRHLLMQKLARGRIQDLIELAKKTHSENPDLANRYVTIARRIAMGTKVIIPNYFKRYICHKCKQLLVPGKNMRIRINQKDHYGTYLTVTCLSCNHITRYIIKGPARSKKLQLNGDS